MDSDDEISIFKLLWNNPFHFSSNIQMAIHQFYGGGGICFPTETILRGEYPSIDSTLRYLLLKGLTL